MGLTGHIPMKWAIQKETEGTNYRNQRLSFVRQLSLYMNSLGINSYIPQLMQSEAITIPHVLSQDELRAFFNVADTYLPRGSKKWHRLSMEYQVLFRMYYCCGMRLAEGCRLKKKVIVPNFVKHTCSFQRR